MIVNKANRTGLQDWQKISKAWWEDVVKKSTLDDGVTFNPVKLASTLRGYSPEVRNLVLGIKVARKGGPLDELMQNIEMIQRTAPAIFTAKVGPVGMGYGIVRVAGATLAGRPAEAMLRAGTLIVTPMILSKVLASEKGLRVLNEGFKVAPGTQKAMHIASQLSNLISSIERATED